MGSYKKKTPLWIGPMVASHSDDAGEPSTPHSSWAADQSQGIQKQQRIQERIQEEFREFHLYLLGCPSIVN